MHNYCECIVCKLAEIILIDAQTVTRTKSNIQLFSLFFIIARVIKSFRTSSINPMLNWNIELPSRIDLRLIEFYRKQQRQQQAHRRLRSHNVRVCIAFLEGLSSRGPRGRRRRSCVSPSVSFCFLRFTISLNMKISLSDKYLIEWSKQKNRDKNH